MIEPPIDERYERAAVMADTNERHIALRDAHQIGASDSFFAARKELRDTQHERYIFDAGFRRGFDAHESLRMKAQPPCGAGGAVVLPDWDSCSEAMAAGEATVLQRYIYTQEPAGKKDSADFREALSALLASQPAAPVAQPIAYPDGACEAHRNVTSSEPVCIICMGEEIDRLRAAPVAQLERVPLSTRGAHLGYDKHGNTVAIAPVAQVAQAEVARSCYTCANALVDTRSQPCLGCANSDGLPAWIAAAQGATTDGGA